MHTFVWAVAVGGRSLVERAYGCQFVDQRVCRDRVNVLMSVRSSVFEKDGCGYDQGRVPGDDENESTIR